MWGKQMWKEIRELAEEVEEGGSVRLMCHCRQERHEVRERKGDMPCHLEPIADMIEKAAGEIRRGKGYAGDNGKKRRREDEERREGSRENVRGRGREEGGEAMDTKERNRPEEGKERRPSARSRRRDKKRQRTRAAMSEEEGKNQ